VFVALVVVAGALSPAARAQSPDKAQIAAALAAAHARYASLEEGKNADYIPALAKVPSRLFVIALVTVDGEVHTIGDVDQLFSIQSISKVFTLAEVLQERGGAAIEGSVGVDATGQVFNSIVAVEQYKGHEMNSFVNAGAIATTSLVHGANEKDIWAKIIGVHSGRSG
jgi:glutaminase